MMTENEYFYAWLYYFAGGLILIGCWWYITRKIRLLELRYLLRIIVSVSILVPWYTNTQQDYLSPALLIAVLELLFDGPAAFWRAGMPLLTALAAAVSLSSIVFVGRWFFLRGRSA